MSWELLHIEPQESLDAEYTQPQILHYARKINADGEPLLKADGKTVQDHIAQFCEIEVNLGKRVGWKKVSSPDGTQFFEVWLGTRVILPKAGPMSGAWEIRHAVQAIAPESSKSSAALHIDVC